MTHEAKGPVPGRAALGHSLEDFWLDGNEGKLHPAEHKLIAACAGGQLCVIATERPLTPTPDNTVRSALLRFLALGGDDGTPVHEHGVELEGAWIEGLLDLRAANVAPIHILRCRIEKIDARRTKLQLLDLEGTFLEQGLYGDRLSCAASIYLRRDFRTGGSVRLIGAQIGGMLSCSGGTFENSDGSALNLSDAVVGGNVFLTSQFRALGKVVLLGARIGGYLSLRNGIFEHADKTSINCQSIVVDRSLFMQKAIICGEIDFSSAKIGSLVDDFNSWASPKKNIKIDGLTYKRIGGTPAFVNASDRIAWLNLQNDEHLQGDFRPQPWEQLITVLRDSGHPNEARIVAQEKQRALRLAGKIKGFARVLHWLYGALIGYGYRPVRLLGIMAGVWLGVALVFWCSSVPLLAGDSAFISNTRDSQDHIKTGSEVQPFYPLLYSADALLPIDLEYKSAHRLKAGHSAEPWLQGLTALESIFGWIASLLLLAVAGNLLKKD